MLGRGSSHAKECFAGNLIGTDFKIEQNLAENLHDGLQNFNRVFIPVYQQQNPGNTKVGAGLARGALWAVSKGILRGDLVLCPDGKGRCRIGEVTGDYYYVKDGTLMHRRPVRWLDRVIDKSEVTSAIRGSVSSQGTAVLLEKHSREIESLLGTLSGSTGSDAAGAGTGAAAVVQMIADPLALRSKITLKSSSSRPGARPILGVSTQSWKRTGRLRGVSTPSATKAASISSPSARTRSGCSWSNSREDGQEVRGVIFALEDDQRLRRALTMTPGIEFFRYQVSFRPHRA